MTDEKPLYEDPDIMIGSLPHSPENHYLNLINPSFGEPRPHIIQRGFLENMQQLPDMKFYQK